MIFDDVGPRMRRSLDLGLLTATQKTTVGGVWAAECCYAGLKTQNIVGSYEFSDFPMVSQYGLSPGQHIPGILMHKYLKDYAKHHDIVRRIMFRTRVVEIEKLDDGTWKVRVVMQNVNGTSKETLYGCEKLVAGTGLSSVPNPISIPGMESFHRTILSASQLTETAPAQVKVPAIKTVTVLVGSKTSYDSVFSLASAGKKVEWVIRKSGRGSLWMTPEYIHVGPFKIKPEILTGRRFMTWLSPCMWGDADGYGAIRRLLNKTRLGRYFMNSIWEASRTKIVEGNGYKNHPALQALEPDEGFVYFNADLIDKSVDKLTGCSGQAELAFLTMGAIFTNCSSLEGSHYAGTTSLISLSLEL